VKKSRTGLPISVRIKATIKYTNTDDGKENKEVAQSIRSQLFLKPLAIVLDVIIQLVLMIR
jgi:hypothetical protein